jgi:hypothetical protein
VGDREWCSWFKYVEFGVKVFKFLCNLCWFLHFFFYFYFLRAQTQMWKIWFCFTSGVAEISEPVRKGNYKQCVTSILPFMKWNHFIMNIFIFVDRYRRLLTLHRSYELKTTFLKLSFKFVNMILIVTQN